MALLVTEISNSADLVNGNHAPCARESVLRSTSRSATLNGSKIKYKPSTHTKPVPAEDSVEVQTHQACTDNMIKVIWTEDQGWEDPELIPYGPLSIMPTASVLQYATECFEGMKVFRGYDGRLRLFRPMLNCHRMLASAERISLPGFKPEELLKLIKKLCAFEAPKWLPEHKTGSFLYIRPTMFAHEPSLGFEVPRSATLLIFLMYWPIVKPQAGPIMTSESGKHRSVPGLRLLASREDEIRAWPGGTGFAKIGANYGPALIAHGAAKKQGYNQVLWLLGKECQVTEAGSTNFFVIWKTKQEGNLQLITPPLSDRTILAGVTRQSVLDLSRERFATDNEVLVAPEETEMQEVQALEVVEKDFTMFDILDATDENRLMAGFAVGTAFFINPVSHIHFRGREIEIPNDRVTHLSLLRGWITDIIYGKDSNPWSVEIDES